MAEIQYVDSFTSDLTKLSAFKLRMQIVTSYEKTKQAKMHSFLIEIDDLFSLLRLTDTLFQSLKKGEFEFCNKRKDDYKLVSAFGHFKSTWYFLHYSWCCQTCRNSVVLQKALYAVKVSFIL